MNDTQNASDFETLGQFDSLMIIHKGQDGKVKNFRYIETHDTTKYEFTYNRVIRFLINNCLISQRVWRLPFLTGRWKTYKE